MSQPIQKSSPLANLNCLKPLVLLFALFTAITPTSVTLTVVYNTAGGLPMPNPNVALTGRYYHEYSNGLKTFGFSGNGASAVMKLFLYDATMVASYTYSVSENKADGLVMKDPLRVVMIYNTMTLFTYTLSGSGTTYAVSANTNLALQPLNTYVNHLYGRNDPSTNYIYFINSAACFSPGRYDITTNMITYSSVASAPSSPSSYFGDFSGANYIVRAVDLTVSQVYYKNTLGVFKTLTSVATTSGLIDNLNTDNLFFSVQTVGVKKYSVSSSCAGTSYVAVASSSGTFTPDYKPLQNLGSFDAFIVFEKVVNMIRVYTKTTLAQIGASIAYTCGAYSVNGMQNIDNKFYFGSAFSTISSTNSLQFHYLTLDSCTTRTSSICQVCDTGLYRNNLLANNICLYPAQFPAGYGIDSTNNLMAACSIGGCTSCVGNYQTCTACNTAGGYYFYSSSCYLLASLPSGVGLRSSDSTIQSCVTSGCSNCRNDYNVCQDVTCVAALGQYPLGTVCYTTSTVPDTYGLNSATSTFVACQDTNCLKCASNYQVCTACKTSNGYYLLNNQCYTTTNVPDTYGFNSATTSMSPCQTTNCQKCSSDYQVCTQCMTSTGYYLLSNQCYTASTIPNFYGYNSVTNSISACQVANCKVCQANYQVCTQCSTSPMYYLLSNTCYTTSTTPDFYGLNSATNTLVSCQTNNCQKCQSNYQTCTQCTTASSYYLLSNACYTTSSVPATYGLNSATNNFVACNVANCLNCSADYLTCTQCNAANGYYILTNQCYSTTTVPDTYGVNSVTGSFVSCQVLNCQKCASNYQVCTNCNTASGYYLISNFCYTVSGLPTGFGVDPVTNTVTGCQDVNCITCPTFSVCTVCDTGKYLLNGHCYTTSTLPAGYGLNTVTNTIVTCQLTGCSNCRLDYTVCNSPICDTSTGQYALNNSCYTTSTVPSRYGFNSGLSLFMPCLSLDCSNCATNYLFCTQCDQNYFVLVGNCFSYQNIPQRYGIDNSRKSLEQCVVPDCQVCTDDYNRCVHCDPNTTKVLVDGNCNDNTQDTPSEPVCLLKGCKKCSDSLMECVQCDAELGYVPMGGICTCGQGGPPAGSRLDKCGGMLTLTSAKYSLLENKGILTFSQSVTFSEKESFDFKLVKPDNTIEYIYEKVVSIEVKGKIVNVQFNFGGSVEFDNSKIYITKITSLSKIYSQQIDSYFTDFPILLNPVRYINEPTYATIGQFLAGSKTSANILKTALLPLTIATGSSASTVPDKLFSTFLYMRFLNGDPLSSPELVFEYLSTNLADVINIVNPFGPYSYDPDCITPFKYSMHYVACNFLYNYGLNYLQLVCTLLICTLFTAIGILTRRKLTTPPLTVERNPKSSRNNTGLTSKNTFSFGTKSTTLSAKPVFGEPKLPFYRRVINYCEDTFGMKMFVAVISSNCFDISSYLFVNMWFAQKYTWSIVSLAFGLVLLLCMIFIEVSIIGFYLQLRKEVAKIKKGNSAVNVLKSKKLFEVINPKTLRWRYMAIFYEGIRAESTSLGLIWPLIEQTRPVLISLTLLCLHGQGIIQPIIILFEEIVYFLTLLYSRAQVNGLDKVLDIGNYSVLLIYLICQITSFSSSITSKNKQSILGNFMAILLIVTIAVNLLLTLGHAIRDLAIRPLIRYLKRKSRLQKTVSITSNRQSNSPKLASSIFKFRSSLLSGSSLSPRKSTITKDSNSPPTTTSSTSRLHREDNNHNGRSRLQKIGKMRIFKDSLTAGKFTKKLLHAGSSKDIETSARIMVSPKDKS